MQSEMAAKQTQIDQLNQKLKDRTTDWDKEGNRLDENTKRRKGNADSRVRLRQTHKGSNLGSIVDNLATDPKEVT